MLEGILGNLTREKILLFLATYQEGYARRVAQTFELNLSAVQRMLENMEREGVLVSRLVGKTRLYQFNPKWHFQPELQALLKKALLALTPEERKLYFVERTRPRREGKELWPSPEKPRSRS